MFWFIFMSCSLITTHILCLLHCIFSIQRDCSNKLEAIITAIIVILIMDLMLAVMIYNKLPVNIKELSW